MKKYSLQLVVLIALVAICALVLTGGRFTANAQSSGGSLSGWAWSSNIGWLSASSTQQGALGGGPYGLTVDNSGYINGYMWSPNIGWVKFGGLLSGFPTNGTTLGDAKVNLTTGAVTGWARACAGTASGNCSSMTSRTDGWDGWIELSGMNHTSPNTAGTGGVTYIPSTGNFIGYAWGSTNVGWVSFNGVKLTIGQPSVTVTPPTVTTNNASLVTQNTATLNGSITSTGGSSITQSGFAYSSTSPNLSAGNTATTTDGAQSGIVSFSHNLTSLTSNNKYYFRAYAINSAGTGYGNIFWTTTLSGAAVINGGWLWGDWSACSNGSQSRSASCTNPSPANGGAQCSGDSTQTQSCTPSNTCINGGWLWGDWSVCSNGSQSRSASCTNPSPTSCGLQCSGDSTQTQSCTPPAIGSCPIPANVILPNPCSSSNPSGAMTRVYNQCPSGNPAGFCQYQCKTGYYVKNNICVDSTIYQR